MRLPKRIIDLLLIAAGFGAALLIHNYVFHGGLGVYGALAGLGTSIIAFWVAIELRNGSGNEPAVSWWVVFIEQFCLGTGVNLLLHSVLTYALFIRRTPILIVLGGFFAAGLLTIYARWRNEQGQAQQRFLLVGFDSVTASVMRHIRQPLIGAIAADAAQLPPGTPWLGGFGALEAVLAQYRPTNIVVNMREWSRRIPPAVLLRCRLAGVEVEGAPALYEKLLNRVCCERLRPGDLLLSSALRGDSRTMAIQAVYTNLIGLLLLLLLSPLLVLIALTIAMTSGPGPMFESFECAGFQYIPFRLHRFRVHKNGTNTLTGAGRWIERLRLTNLPQLVNVVRGDMALVGPSPVRLTFANYLTEVMPFYSHRFSVKPGILGWAQMHARQLENASPSNLVSIDECRQIEYDLFYIKEGSLWMDIEIMMARLLPAGRLRDDAMPASESGVV